MGNHHSHELKEQGGNGMSTPRGGSRRASSQRGSVPNLEKPEKQQQVSFVPVEKLAKLLTQRSQKEEGVNGVTEKCFTKYLFPQYPELARRFFRHVHRAGGCRDRHVPPAVFRAQCERVLALLDDAAIVDTYVRMFGCETEEGAIMADGFRSLLYTSYKLSMDHYPEGPQTCLMINKTLSAVVSGCFNNKESHSVGFVVRWMHDHCHRIIFPMHRYCVHMLATRHRDMEAAATGAGGAEARESLGTGLELATPVLERCPWGGAGVGAGEAGDALLPISAAWLLAAAAPPLYSRPVHPPAPAAHAGGLASAAWVARLVCAVPSHWAPLYASQDHGLGANRFLHHTLAYRGPTLVVVAAQELVVVVCSPQEWRETHQYWGGPDCALIQLQPTFCVVERGPRMLYLNTSIRGYPHGLRAGADPRKPLLDIHQDFDSLTFQSVPYNISSIEVWGCGDQASRDTQLEIKKWQVKEAERQRTVKLSAADWIEHPDRYLLELAGRPQYNSTS